MGTPEEDWALPIAGVYRQWSGGYTPAVVCLYGIGPPRTAIRT